MRTRMIGIVFFLVVVLAVSAGMGATDNLCATYHKAAAGTKFVPAYPFEYTEYWMWSAVPPDEPVMYEITGMFPFSRGMNFQAYDSATTLPGDTLNDQEIVPESGSSNPFLPDVDRYVEDRSYTVWFVPAAYATGKGNVLIMPEGNINATMILRIIRHDPVEHLPLPVIKAYDAATGKAVSCPRQGLPANLSVVLNAIKELFQIEVPIESPTFEFYRYKPDSFIPNTNTHYLTAAVDAPSEGNIAAVWYRVPSFTDTYNDPDAMFTGNEDVRHSGICIHGLYSTIGMECLVDDEFPSDMAYIIVGPDDDTVRNEAKRRGYMYLHLGNFEYPLIMYRQRLPRSDFEGSAAEIPFTKPTELNPQAAASHYMGEYAPRGRVCTLAAFMAGDNCGFPPAFQMTE